MEFNEIKEAYIKLKAFAKENLNKSVKENRVETAKYLSSKRILGIKIHMLHILKNTNLLKLYLKENFC